MKVIYYPGCTLYEKSKELDRGTREAAKELGMELFELPNWTCCGAAYPLSTDNVIGIVAAGRILANARKYGETLTTLCAFCYNVLKRVNRVMGKDIEKRNKVNAFIEEDYKGDLKVLHFLEVLAEYGSDALREKVKRPLKMKVLPYYGCQLLRPEKEMEMDSQERPTIFERVLQNMGCQLADFPYKTECCGSYHIMKSPGIAYRCSYQLMDNATKNGAEALAVTCPLCYFNMETKQIDILQNYPGLRQLPVFYLTELLSLSLGLKIDAKSHSVDVTELLEKHGLGELVEVRK